MNVRIPAATRRALAFAALALGANQHADTKGHHKVQDHGVKDEHVLPAAQALGSVQQLDSVIRCGMGIGPLRILKE